MSDLVAPARYVWRGTAHLRDPDRSGEQPELVDGWTVCGTPMLASELWQSVSADQVTAVCRGCEAPDQKPEEMTLL